MDDLELRLLNEPEFELECLDELEFLDELVFLDELIFLDEL